MQIFLWTLVFIGSLYVLVKSADYFTVYSEKLGLLFGMSSFIIGATIVAVGTSLPELVSSLYAVVNTGESAFVVDSIIGSNIANALLILGIGGIVAKVLKVKTNLLNVDLPFFFISMGMFVFFIMDKVITWPEGIALAIFFIIFVVYSFKSSKEEVEEPHEIEKLKEQFNGNGKRHKLLSIAKYVGIIIIMMACIAFGAKYFIDSLLTISELAGITSSLLTLSVVAIGTSLPEILTSVKAIRLGNHGMAIGNVFGSNIFNIALVGSIPAFFGDLAVNEVTFKIGLPFLIFATLAAIFATIDNKIPRWEGVGLLFLYVLFLLKTFGVL